MSAVGPVSVYSAFLKTTSKYGRSPFLHIPAQAAKDYSPEPIDFTYAEASEAVERLKGTYGESGYGAGQRVALVLDNRADFFLHFLALNSLGVSVVPINAGLQIEEISYLLDHSDVCLIVSLPRHLEPISRAVTRTQRVIPAVRSDALDDLSRAPERGAGLHAVGLSAEAAILYTSGTTGKPKGCILSNDYFLELGTWYLQLGGLCAIEAGTERLMTPLPVNHMNAMACSFTAMLMSGGCLIQVDRFHPSMWWDTVRVSRATIIHYLGVMPAMLLNLPVSEEDDFSGQIKFGFGAGVDPRHQERFEERFGFPLVEAWAMTETGAGACTVVNEEPRNVGTRCIGKPPARMEYELIDENGREVAPGMPGELLVRAAGENPRRGFFSGYYKDSHATDEAWAGGWFHTGDVVRHGEDGTLYFMDRRKNIIRRSGENIAAVEVEGVLFQSDLVQNCVVAPVHDEIRGEEVMACIVLARGIAPTRKTADQIFAFCQHGLTYYKTPGYMAFVEALPVTPSQKVKRGEVKALCRHLLEEGSAFDLRALKRRPKSQNEKPGD